MPLTAPLQPGDVVAVDTGNHTAAELIRLGALIHGQPAPANHVVIVSHTDKAGTLWGIEGRPGGGGYANTTRYVTGQWAPYADANTALPRTPEQSRAVCQAAVQLLGTPYDWAGGIAADAATALRLPGLAEALDRFWGWPQPAGIPGTGRPGHVVCSSLAAWIYGHLGLPHPAVPGELCTPADWWAYNAAIKAA